MEKETKIQTLSLVAGTEACNARCPFCISKMTPQGVAMYEEPINWVRFQLVAEMAKSGEVNAAMITGKGEPTLFPGHITGYLENLLLQEKNLNFAIPSKELQTNAIIFDRKREKYDPLLNRWKQLDLNTIAISIVHFEEDKNRQIYLPYSSSYIDLPSVLSNLKGLGFKTRLACIMIDGFIDSSDKVKDLIDFAAKNNVDELTVRPVNKPDGNRSAVFDWTSAHFLKPEQMNNIRDYLEKSGTVIKDFPFGARIYDVNGQNVCLTNSLTKEIDSSYLRQLIFFPNGRIATDWLEEDSKQ